jgi:hypothetical protein
MAQSLANGYDNPGEAHASPPSCRSVWYRPGCERRLSGSGGKLPHAARQRQTESIGVPWEMTGEAGLIWLQEDQAPVLMRVTVMLTPLPADDPRLPGSVTTLLSPRMNKGRVRDVAGGCHRWASGWGVRASHPRKLGGLVYERDACQEMRAAAMDGDVVRGIFSSDAVCRLDTFRRRPSRNCSRPTSLS